MLLSLTDGSLYSYCILYYYIDFILNFFLLVISPICLPLFCTHLSSFQVSGVLYNCIIFLKKGKIINLNTVEQKPNLNVGEMLLIIIEVDQTAASNLTLT